MQGNVKDLVVVVELLLSSVSVVDVPVEYAHLLALSLRHLGCDCDVVEHAEASYFVALCMVARRSCDAVSSLKSRTLVKQLLNPSHSSEGRDQSSKVALMTEVKVLLSFGQSLILG